MNVIDEERQGRKVGPLAPRLSLSDLANVDIAETGSLDLRPESRRLFLIDAMQRAARSGEAGNARHDVVDVGCIDNRYAGNPVLLGKRLEPGDDRFRRSVGSPGIKVVLAVGVVETGDLTLVAFI